MGCFASTPKDTGGNRRKPTSIGEVSVYVPGLRIPRAVEFSQAVGDQLPKTLVERLTALRTRIVVMANQEGPTITRTRRKTQHGIYLCLRRSFVSFVSLFCFLLFTSLRRKLFLGRRFHALRSSSSFGRLSSCSVGTN